MRFICRRRWFVLVQTDGQALAPMAIPVSDQVRALAALQIDEVPFDETNGNVLPSPSPKTR